VAIVGTNGITGIAIGGAAVVAVDQPLTGFAVSVGEVRGEDGIEGMGVGAYRVRASDLTGLGVAVAWTKIGDLTGTSIAGMNYVYGEQRGLTIGIFNYARALHGVQIGLLNYAGNNEGIFKLTPVVNLNLK